MVRKKVVVLGATGSIGKNTFHVLQQLPEHFEVSALVARNSLEQLISQAVSLKCPKVITSDVNLLNPLKQLAPASILAEAGEEAVIAAVTAPEVDVVLCAIVGIGGVKPVIAALRANKTVALASKEVLVMAGDLVMALVRSGLGRIIPVDSEHSAIFQCLKGHKTSNIERLILTASGGAFRDKSYEEMAQSTYREALNHPVWSMGPKVTIDSASLMNKALEIVEAGYLFDVKPDKISVVIHPQSLVHSMVEFVDGALLAQLSVPDMRFAIQYALTYPERCNGHLPRMPLDKLLEMTFLPPDRRKYPSLDFAFEALRCNGTMPLVMNAANEVAVERFKNADITFTDIWRTVEKTMQAHHCCAQENVEQLMVVDAWARGYSANLKF